MCLFTIFSTLRIFFSPKIYAFFRLNASAILLCVCIGFYIDMYSHIGSVFVIPARWPSWHRFMLLSFSHTTRLRTYKIFYPTRTDTFRALDGYACLSVYERQNITLTEENRQTAHGIPNVTSASMDACALTLSVMIFAWFFFTSIFFENCLAL